MDNKIVKVLLNKKIHNEIIDLVPLDNLNLEHKKLINTISLAHKQYEGDLNLDEIKELHLQKYVFTPTKLKILERVINNIKEEHIGSPELVRDLIKGLHKKEIARTIAEKALLIYDQGSGDFNEIEILARQNYHEPVEGQIVTRFATDMASILTQALNPHYRFPFNLLSLQSKTVGLGRGDNVIVFGRPEQGKTSFVCHCVAGWLAHYTPISHSSCTPNSLSQNETKGEIAHGENAQEDEGKKERPSETKAEVIGETPNIHNERKGRGKGKTNNTKTKKHCHTKDKKTKGLRQTKVAYFCNEEPTYKIALSICRAVFGKTTKEITALSVSELERWNKLREGLFLFDATGWSLGDIGNCCSVVEPDIIIIDQTDKLRSDTNSTIQEFHLSTLGNKNNDPVVTPSRRSDPRIKQLVNRSVGKNAGSWERMGPLYAGIREIGRIFNVATINITQASAEADGKMAIGYQSMAHSKTDKAAEADLVIGIGSYNVDVVEDDGIRHISLSKNKISGIKGTWNVFFNTERCTFTD